MTETVLITGANGLVGNQLVTQLGETGQIQVIATDLRLPDDAHRHPVVQYDTLNVCDPDGIENIFAQYKPSVVIHLASIVTPGAGDTREYAYQVDVVGTHNILQACHKHQCKRIVVTSSGAAYGYHADNPVPLKEQHTLRGNLAFAYSDHKRQVEELLAEARQKHPLLEQVVLRVGTVLGEQVDNQITALFHKKRLLGVRGVDSPFVFIWDEDLANILCRAASSGPAGIFNVCGDGAMSLDSLANALGKPTLKMPANLMRLGLSIGKSLGIGRYGPEQLCFLQFRPVLDNARLKRDFGYTPALNSEQAFLRWAKHVELIE